MTEDDEVITVQLPRRDYKILRKILEREEAYNWFHKMAINHWIFIMGGGTLTLVLLWEKIQTFLHGIK